MDKAWDKGILDGLGQVYMSKGKFTWASLHDTAKFIFKVYIQPPKTCLQSKLNPFSKN